MYSTALVTQRTEISNTLARNEQLVKLWCWQELRMHSLSCMTGEIIWHDHFEREFGKIPVKK